MFGYVLVFFWPAPGARRPQLVSQLPDLLNAEIVLGTVQNAKEAIGHGAGGPLAVWMVPASRTHGRVRRWRRITRRVWRTIGGGGGGFLNHPCPALSYRSRFLEPTEAVK